MVTQEQYSTKRALNILGLNLPFAYTPNALRLAWERLNRNGNECFGAGVDSNLRLQPWQGCAYPRATPAYKISKSASMFRASFVLVFNT